MIQNCNDCASDCRGKDGLECPNRTLPKGGFTFAELLLSHPQSTHDTLSNLPFKVNMEFYFR